MKGLYFGSVEGLLDLLAIVNFRVLFTTFTSLFNLMKRSLFTALIIIVSLYSIVCLLVYLYQEKLIFLPQRLPHDYSYQFNEPFEELFITTADNKKLNALLFTSDGAKGLIFYLHGNAGSLASWGEISTIYTSLGYDLFMIDYRGYGKSEGKITSEQQMIEDVQLAYNKMKKRYAEEKIVILGYSLGTGPSTRLARVNNPRLLILQSPYYSLKDIAKKTIPFVPSFLLKYPLRTYEHLPGCKMPVALFHGTDDKLIPYSSSLRLKDLCKPGDTLIALAGLGHNGMTRNPDYQAAIKELLK